MSGENWYDCGIGAEWVGWSIGTDMGYESETGGAAAAWSSAVAAAGGRGDADGE